MANAFPAKRGMSQVLSPMEFVTGRILDANIDLKALFGSYVEASYDREVTTDLRDRTHGCTAPGASGHLQGSLKCFDLTTGLVVTRHMYTVMPLTEKVAARLNWWGKRTTSGTHENKLEFRNRNGAKYDWDHDEQGDTEGLIDEGEQVAPPPQSQ